MISKISGSVPYLFVLSVPLFLITAGVTWAVNDLSLYSRGFQQHGISEATGIDQSELMEIARDLRSYFNSIGKPLDVQARVYGELHSLFSPQETRHMADVRNLVWLVYVTGAISGIYMFCVTTLGITRHGPQFTTRVSKWILWGGVVTTGLIVTIGMLTIFAFESLFLAFHRISFANDLWKLDPTRDYLVILFPEPFWFDATMFVALIVLTGAIATSAISAGFLISNIRLTKGRST